MLVKRLISMLVIENRTQNVNTIKDVSPFMFAKSSA